VNEQFVPKINFPVKSQETYKNRKIPVDTVTKCRSNYHVNSEFCIHC
jgi:hypothetical protein